MVIGIIFELEHLTLASGPEVLGEGLRARTQLPARKTEISVPASHLPGLAAGERVGSRDLIHALGISQPSGPLLGGLSMPKDATGEAPSHSQAARLPRTDHRNA